MFKSPKAYKKGDQKGNKAARYRVVCFYHALFILIVARVFDKPHAVRIFYFTILHYLLA
jgi:hypothetical protein